MERARLLLQGGLLQGGRPLPRASKLGDDAASPGGAQESEDSPTSPGGAPSPLSACSHLSARSPQSARAKRLAAEAAAARAAGPSVAVVVRCRPLPVGEEDRLQIGVEEGANGQVSVRLHPDASSIRFDSPRMRPGGGGAGCDGSGTAFRCDAFCGEESVQEDILKHALPCVELMLEGRSGAICCLGAPGSGKSHTLFCATKAGVRKGEAQGLLQLAAERIFEHAGEHPPEELELEASFLAVHSPEGEREQLTDLLAGSGESPERKHFLLRKSLEFREDPADAEAVVCRGLRGVQVRSPEDLRDVLEAGLRASRGLDCHKVLTLSMTRVAAGSRGLEPQVLRGKLAFVEFSGSEGPEKVPRLFTGGQTSASAPDSGLAMALRSYLTSSSRALLVATIGVEVARRGEAVATLASAQRVALERCTQQPSALEQLRQRHLECIHQLQQTAIDMPTDKEELLRMHGQLSSLGQRLTSGSSACETLEIIQEEQRRKMDEMRTSLTELMAREFATLQEQTFADLKGVAQTLEAKTRQGAEMFEQQQLEKIKAEEALLQQKIDAAVSARRAAEKTTAEKQVQLAVTEQRVEMLQELQREAAGDRGALDEERRELHRKAQTQFERLIGLEEEMQRHRSQAELQRARIERLQDERDADAAGARQELQEHEALKASLQTKIESARAQLQEQTDSHDARALQAESRHGREVQALRARIERLQAEGSAQRRGLEDLQRTQALTAQKVSAAKFTEVAVARDAETELQRFDEEIDAANQRADELVLMLKEVQNSVMNSSPPKAKTPMSPSVPKGPPSKGTTPTRRFMH